MNDETQGDNDTVVEQAPEAKLEFDPKAMEEQMIAAAQARAEDPTETASQAYGMYVPHYKASIPKLSTRGLRRLLNYLVLYPLDQTDFKAANDFEKQMMQLTGQLVEAKFIMILDTYNQHATELYEAQNTPLTQEQADEIADELGVERKTVTQENKDA